MTEEPLEAGSRLSDVLHPLFDAMFEGIQIIDPDWRYVYLNEAAARHGRRPIGELVGRTMMETYPGIEDTEMFGLLRRCMTERTPHQIVNRFTYPDGRTGWFDLRINPVPMGILVLSVDISAQKSVEEELRRSRENLATTLECMAEGVVTTDTDGRVTGMNPAAEALTGWSAHEAMGRPLDDLVRFLNHGTGAAVDHVAARILRDGMRIGLANDTLLEARDGTRVPIASSGVPIRHADDTIRGAVMVLKDMQEEYRLTSLLHHAQKMEAVGRLASGMAHDFNNILSVITGYGDMALQQVSESDPLRAELQEIVNAGERGAALTRQLLAFSRRRPHQPEVLDVNEIVSGMEKLLRRLVGEHIDLATHLDPDLDPVRFDPGQIEQIVMNLVVNARDAMPLGGTLTIDTGNVELDNDYARSHPGAAVGPHVMIAVTDSGQGMDEATREQIFEPFFTTKEHGKGTGLGLSTLYGIVKQGGGNIWVYSELGQGTIFKVYLPRADETRTIPEATAPPHRVATGTETVLVVEDEAPLRTLIRKVLTKSGYTVLDAASAEEALDLCDHYDGPIHLVLTDVVLPGMSGPDMTDRLLAGRPELRVAYMSGYTDDAIVDRGLLERTEAFIEKPMTASGLLTKVREFLG